MQLADGQRFESVQHDVLAQEGDRGEYPEGRRAETGVGGEFKTEWGTRSRSGREGLHANIVVTCDSEAFPAAIGRAIRIGRTICLQLSRSGRQA